MGSIIRVAALVMSGLVLLGFGLFAIDELDHGSKTQQRALSSELRGTSEDVAAIPRTAGDEAAREAAHNGVREVVDDVNDVLLSPFVDLVDSEDAWVSRGVPPILALLVYGFGLGLVASMLPEPRVERESWRGAGL